MTRSKYNNTKCELAVPESKVVDACIKWLWQRGVFCWRNNTGALRDKRNHLIRFGKVGSPDIIGIAPWSSCHRGKFIGIECKSSTGKMTPHQEEFCSKVTANFGIYIVARSIDDLEAAGIV